MTKLLFTIGLISVFSSCNNELIIENPNQKKESMELNEHAVLKVYVDKDGKISANNVIVRLVILDEQLKDLKDKNGIIYYSRANVTSEPPEESMKVMQMVIKYELPIRLYTDRTFTTPIKG